MNRNKRFSQKVLALLLAVVLLLPLSLASCGQKTGDPLLTLEGQTFTVNMYQLLLSRVKGNLARNGYNVSGDTLWETVIDSDHSTYEEYVRRMTLEDAKEYLAVAVLFDELGLSLSDADVKAVDREIRDLIDNRADGSKNAFNALLAEFGANVDILREMMLLEAKYAAVRAKLYGSDGSKIGTELLQAYLDDNAVCFRQILIRSHGYVYEKDANGDEIYYIPTENNGKASNVAYDTATGVFRLDNDGKIITDKNGDNVYYTANGHIAYDKANGVRAMVYDESGNPKTTLYPADVLAEHRSDALEILAKAKAGDALAFESLLLEFADADMDDYVTDAKYCFLYTTGDNGYDYLNDLADALVELKPGEATLLDSEYGYHVIMRYDMPKDAAANDDYKEWFPDLVARVADQLFASKCAPYVEKVQVDEGKFASVPPMKEIGTNFYY